MAALGGVHLGVGILVAGCPIEEVDEPAGLVVLLGVRVVAGEDREVKSLASDRRACVAGLTDHRLGGLGRQRLLGAVGRGEGIQSGNALGRIQELDAPGRFLVDDLKVGQLEEVEKRGLVRETEPAAGLVLLTVGRRRGDGRAEVEMLLPARVLEPVVAVTVLDGPLHGGCGGGHCLGRKQDERRQESGAKRSARTANGSLSSVGGTRRRVSEERSINGYDRRALEPSVATPAEKR